MRQFHIRFKTKVASGGRFKHETKICLGYKGQNNWDKGITINGRGPKRTEKVGDEKNYPRIQTTNLKKAQHLSQNANLLYISCHKQKFESSLRTRQASVAYPRIQTTNLKKAQHLLRDANMLYISCHKQILELILRTRQTSLAYLYE